MISLSSLGSLHLIGGEGPLLPGRRKILALLACVLRRAPERVPRSELILLFWPDRSDNHAKQSLRQALAELRPVLGEALESDGESVFVDPARCRIDTLEFENAVCSERWDEAAALWGGDFLHGLECLGGDRWASWLVDQRTVLREQAATVFQSLLAAAESRDERKSAAEWAHKWADVAPLDESACAARVRTLVRLGRPIDAAVCYESFVRRLHSERQCAPSAEFESLRQTFAADRRRSPDDHFVVRGRMTLSGLTQLSADARYVAEAAAIAAAPADAATLQRLSGITSFSFRAALDELAEHGILTQKPGTTAWDFTTEENRERISRVIPSDRRAALQAIQIQMNAGTSAARPKRQRTPLVDLRRLRLPVRPMAFVGGAAAVLALVAGINWAARVATASALAVEPGSTVLLAETRDSADPSLAQAINTAARLGLGQSRHLALYRGERSGSLARGSAAGEAALARNEQIPRIIAIDIDASDSSLKVAARVMDGATGAVLGEEKVATVRPRLVDDLDGLLRRLRVSLGESESVVRDSSRPLHAVASSSIEALSAYAAGSAAWERGLLDSARVSWEKALALDTGFALVELALAREALAREDSERGAFWARRARLHGSRLTDLDALRVDAIIARQEGRLKDAAVIAEQVAVRAPSPDAWYDLAEMQVAAGDCSDASGSLERALAVDSTHTRSRLMMAACALETGDSELALRTIETARRISPDAVSDMQYARLRGMALVKEGRLDEAESAFRGGLTSGAASDSAVALRWLAQLAMMRGRYSQALPALQNVTRIYRSADQSREAFGSLVMETGAFIAIGGRTRASELIDEAWAVATTTDVPVSGFFRLGHLMARIGRINGAREALRVATLRAGAGDASDAGALHLLAASIALVERNGAAALAALDSLSDPSDLEPFRLALSADALAQSGQHAAALSAAKRLAQSWQFGTGAQDEWIRATLRVARISEAAGDTISALAAYRKFVDRWKDADIFLVELAAAQRSLVRLGGGTVASR